MSRGLPIACALLLACLLAWQLAVDAVAPAPESLQRVPVFSPASMGISSSGGTRCPGAQPVDPLAGALTQVPLDALLGAVSRDQQPRSPELQAALGAVAEHHRALLDLRNQRHAWNVESMELVTELAAVLEPEQLDWVLSNRDRVSRERLDQGVWQQLGIEP